MYTYCYLSDTTKCICQVFYRKLSVNCWKIIFAFFPDDKADVSDAPKYMLFHAVVANNFTFASLINI